MSLTSVLPPFFIHGNEKTLLAQGRRRKRSAPPSFQEVAGPLNLDDDGDTDANYDGLDDLDLSTWMRGATRAAVPLAVAHLVEPRAGQEGTCIQRTLCEANAELRRRADVRGVAASLLLTHGTNELISTTPEEQEANLRAASAGSSAKNCTLVSARCSEVEYNEISRVSEKLFNFASNFLVSRPA